MTKTQEKIVQWLQRMDYTHVMPVTLVIDEKQYEGAAYTQGKERHFYLAGNRPQPVVETCYRFEGNQRDWYVASYLDNYDGLTPSQQEFHPVGNNWVLVAWDHLPAIDIHATEPYQRVKVTFA
jgi:hypothetical protein